MKKVFSIVLAAAMMMSCFVTSASADSGHDQPSHPMPTFTLSFRKLDTDGMSDMPGDPVAGDMFQAIVKVTGISTIWSTHYKISYDSEVVTLVTAHGVASESEATCMSKPIRDITYRDWYGNDIKPMNTNETIIYGTETREVNGETHNDTIIYGTEEREVNGETHKVFGYGIDGDPTATWPNAALDDEEAAGHVHIDPTEGVVLATFRFMVLKEGNPKFSFLEEETFTYTDKRREMVSKILHYTAMGTIVGTVAGNTFGDTGPSDHAAVNAAVAMIKAISYTTPGNDDYLGTADPFRSGILTAMIEADLLERGLDVTIAYVDSNSHSDTVDGTEENPNGTDGRWDTDYRISKRAVVAEIKKELIVTAIPYSDIKLDRAAVDAAVAAIEAKTYTTSGNSAFIAASSGARVNVLTAMVKVDVTDVKVGAVSSNLQSLPVNGTKENPAGTNGKLSIDYNISRGQVTESITKDFIITAIPYDNTGDLDRAAVAAAAAAIEAETYTISGDSAFVAASSAEKEIILDAMVEADVLALDTGVTVRNGGSNAYIPPVNGTKENPAGTNGRYPLVYSFSKGVATASITKNFIITAIPYLAAGVQVDGYVKLFGSNTVLAGVTVKLADGVETTTDSKGHFAFASVVAGNYNVVFSGKGSIARTIPVVVASQDLSISKLDGMIDLILGDLINDGIVNLQDYAAFGRQFNKKQGDAAFTGDSDLIADGIVNLQDYAVFGKFFNKTAASYATWVIPQQ